MYDRPFTEFQMTWSGLWNYCEEFSFGGKGRGNQSLAEYMGEKGGCMKSLNKMHASIGTRVILALRASGERAGKGPAYHAEILVRAELE